MLVPSPFMDLFFCRKDTNKAEGPDAMQAHRFQSHMCSLVVVARDQRGNHHAAAADLLAVGPRDVIPVEQRQSDAAFVSCDPRAGGSISRVNSAHSMQIN